MEGSNAASPEVRVEVLSPGNSDLRGLAAVAQGLSLPVSDIAARIWRAPAVLLDRVDRSTAERFVAILATVGLHARVADPAAPIPDPPLFDLAVQVTDPGRVGEVVEALSAALGLEPVQAYELLATPPGSILGGVGEASSLVLDERLGPGARILRSPSGQGPYDLYVEPGTRLPASVLREYPEFAARAVEGYVPLGLEHGEAETLWIQLKSHAGARLIPRALVRFEVVLSRPVTPNPARIALLEAAFGIPRALAPRMLAIAPLSLTDDLTFDDARAAVDRSRRVGIPTDWEPMYFGRAGVRVEEVKDRDEFNRTLTRFGMDLPDRLPALVARNLVDLEARRLMAALSAAGARAQFTEPVLEGANR